VAVHCPRCGDTLRERTQVGVTVEACERCRGMWLDRGGLEAILAVFRARAWTRAAAPVRPARSGHASDLRARLKQQTWDRLLQLFD
jgi:Zn-finger nucleic acid-binding protein